MAGRLDEEGMDMVLPHELWARLFHFYKDAFFRFVVPALDVVERFWNAVAGGAACVSVCVCVVFFVVYSSESYFCLRHPIYSLFLFCTI